MGMKVSLDDRLRAGPQRPARASATRTLRRALARRARPPAAQLPPIVAINRGPLRSETRDAQPMTPRQLEQARDDGALVVDVRTDLQFDEAHIPGAVCHHRVARGLRHQARLGRRARARRSSGGPRRRGRARAPPASPAAVGVTTLAGHLAGGMTSWREEGRPSSGSSASTSPGCTSARRRPRVQILDVRERRMGRGPHPRLGPRALPRHRGIPAAST